MDEYASGIVLPGHWLPGAGAGGLRLVALEALTPVLGADALASCRARPSPLFKHAEGRANTAASIAQLVHLGLAQLSPDHPESVWYRAEWWQHIIGGSRAALFAHLVRLVKRGVIPVLLYGDALWVVSDDPHPFTAVPGLLNEPRWNSYCVGYTVPLTLSRDVQHIFQTVTSPDHAVELLDALAHEEGHPAEK